MAAYRLSFVALICVLLQCVYCVDRNNFKTCDQSGFCKRQRSYSSNLEAYRVSIPSLKLSNEAAEFTVVNVINNIEFVVRLKAYKTGVVRVYMNEKNPVKPRYEVPKGDVVFENLLSELLFKLQSKDETSFVLKVEGTETLVKVSSPFLIDVSDGQRNILKINSRGLLKFEHIRIKPAPEVKPVEETSTDKPDQDNEDKEEQPNPPVPEAKEETAPAVEEKPNESEEHAVWDEKFKTHDDSKPNGATSIGLDMSFVGFEYVYGIPEHADSLALKSTVGKDPYRLYNLDVFEYELNNGMALYGSVPVMLAHNVDRTVGVFWNNPSEMWIDISNSKQDRSTFGKIVDFVTNDNTIPQVDTRWVAESGVLDLYVLLGPRPNDVYRQYAKLTGTTSLPPIFSLAYHQSRWNYNDEADVKQVHDQFDGYDIPMDVIWLDIEHTDGKRYFTWDASKFPTSLEMVTNLTAKGRKLVTIVDPHIKRDDNYRIYKEIKDRDLFIKDSSGGEFDGWCWPGTSSYPDFTRADMREFWASKYAFDDYTGTNEDVYTWNDMNEPSVFNGPEITMHKDAKHANGWEHRDVHNLYGFYVHQASYEGHIKRTNGALRPFVLSRAFYAGSQRHGAVWTGDNTGEWGHLKISVAMILSQSITGITFTGADVGGFFKNPNAELLTRWYQTAAFLPFFRAHAHIDTRRREPWLQPDENRNIIREAIITRYALLPYWYTLFYVNEQEGIPPVRPLWSEFPEDPSLFTEDEEFMLGSGILVRTVLDEGVSGVNIVFPGGSKALWYSAANYQTFQGGSKVYYPVTLKSIPYFYRGGQIVPRKDRLRRSTVQMSDDPYTLIVALDSMGESTGELYVDDYKSFRYREGEFAYRRLSFRNGQLTNSAIIQTNFKTVSWLETVHVLGVKSKPSSVKLVFNGVTTELSFKYNPATSVLTIRKPACNIAEDWTISINQ